MVAQGKLTFAAAAVRWLAARPLLPLLIFQTALLGWAATRHSPGIDEVGHLAAGLHHWQTGTFDLYRVNPPLVRLVATAPVAAAGVELPTTTIDTEPPARPEFTLGWNLVDCHGREAFRYFVWARWACLPFAWLGTVVVYRWGRELYGPPAGLLGAVLWVVCPTVIAHAQMITPDAGAAGLGAAAGYLFWRWLRFPAWGGALAAGFVLGLAELCKTTWIILAPLWPVLWVAYRFRSGCWAAWSREATQLAAAGLLALYIINAGYGFEDVGWRLGDIPLTSRAFTSDDELGRPLNRSAGTAAGGLPVPLPRNYVQGIDVQKRDFEAEKWSYLRGEWRTHGWWYYYLYGLLVKTPVGTLAVFGLAMLRSLVGGRPTPNWRDEIVLLATGLAVIGFVSSQTGINRHLRYVLPGLPFLFIWAGRAATYAGPRRGAWRAAVATAVAAAAASSLAVYPHSMSYFNEPAGGPLRGSEHLVDSNIDWGQDLLYLKEWYDTHPEARPFHLAYYGAIDPQAAGIEFTLPPKRPRPGWYAVSVTLLREFRHPVPNGAGRFARLDDAYGAYFQRCRPSDRAGYSIYIYRLNEAECARIHAELGPPAGAQPKSE